MTRGSFAVWLVATGAVLLSLNGLTACSRREVPVRGADELPFELGGLRTAEIDGEAVHLPRDPYSIFVNYELGMHCVGFDMNYCCVIPPYNSIQAQAVRTASAAVPKPRLLSPADGVTLHYSTDDNTYSEGDKMAYWGCPRT